MQFNPWKLAFLSGAALCALAPAEGAFAQNAPPSDKPAASNEEILTVTARRREESLQAVPVAVTAISAETLERQGAPDITALTRSTPNVTFEVSRGTNSTLTAFIRGVGQQDPLWGFEPGVGLYVDDVYIARPQGAILDIFDIDRLEVLRGPQGTLYGRNTIGGAIKYVTHRIGNDPHASATLNLGTYNQHDVILSGSTPINDMVAVSGALAIYNRDGYGKNVTTGAAQGNKDLWAGRVTVEFTPNDKLFVRLAADKTEDSSNANHGHRELPARAVGENYPVLSSVYDTRAGAGDANFVKTGGVSLQAEYAVNDALTLKSITASRSGSTDTVIDFDGLPPPDLDVPAHYSDSQVTQEFQADVDLGKLHGVAGVFYLNGVADGAFDTVLGTSKNVFFPNGTTVLTQGKVSTLSLSYFADFTYDLTEKLSLSVGGRYTEDKKTATVLRQNYNGVRSPLFGNSSAVPFGGPATNFRRDRTDEKFSPRLSASYKLSDDLMVYASYSQGFKSGGFDPRANFAATPAAAQPLVLKGFEPEIVDSFEIGAKGKMFDNRLIYRAALFFSDYSDQQVTVQSGVDTNGDGINDNIVSSVFNAGQSSYNGFELEGSYRFTDALSSTFSIGYMDATVDEVISNGVNVQTDANKLNDFVPQNTPEWTANFGGDYVVPLGDLGALDLNGALTYRGEYYIFNTVVNQGFPAGASAAFPAGGPKLDADAVTLLDLNAVWTSANGRYSFGLHGRNLTDERYRVALYNFAYPGTTGIDSAYTAFYGAPRTVVGTLKLNF